MSVNTVIDNSCHKSWQSSKTFVSEHVLILSTCKPNDQSKLTTVSVKIDLILNWLTDQLHFQWNDWRASVDLVRYVLFAFFLRLAYSSSRFGRKVWNAEGLALIIVSWTEKTDRPRWVAQGRVGVAGHVILSEGNAAGGGVFWPMQLQLGVLRLWLVAPWFWGILTWNV